VLNWFANGPVGSISTYNRDARVHDVAGSSVERGSIDLLKEIGTRNQGRKGGLRGLQPLPPMFSGAPALVIWKDHLTLTSGHEIAGD